jgi:hypothetical protein
VLRHFIQDISDHPLSETSHTKKDYLDKVLKMEKNLQEQELYGKHVNNITDATPRMGEMFALIARFISVLDQKATVYKCLVDVTFLNYSLSAATQCGTVQKALMSAHLTHKDLMSASMGWWLLD